jgi:hypothetical protein
MEELVEQHQASGAERPLIEDPVEDHEEEDLVAATERFLDGPKRNDPWFIDDLPDAISEGADGAPLFLPAHKELVVIERWYEGRWLGTSLYRIIRVDRTTGDMHLHDEDLQQAAQANYLTGPKRGWRFKLPITGLRLHGRQGPEKKRRGRKCKSKDD